MGQSKSWQIKKYTDCLYAYQISYIHIQFMSSVWWIAKCGVSLCHVLSSSFKGKNKPHKLSSFSVLNRGPTTKLRWKSSWTLFMNTCLLVVWCQAPFRSLVINWGTGPNLSAIVFPCSFLWPLRGRWRREDTHISKQKHKYCLANSGKFRRTHKHPHTQTLVRERQ